MNQVRLRYIAVAASVCVVSVVAYTLFVREVNQQAQLLEQQLEALTKDQEGEQRLIAVKKLISDTAGPREQVATYYLQSTSDSIVFLNYIEQLAGTNGINLETVRAVDVVQNEQTVLQVSYRIQGPLAPIERFVALLEAIPYVSEMVSLVLQQQSAGQWQADVQLDVPILK